MTTEVLYCLGKEKNKRSLVSVIEGNLVWAGTNLILNEFLLPFMFNALKGPIVHQIFVLCSLQHVRFLKEDVGFFFFSF